MNDDRLRAFLLDELSESERDAVEELVFDDPAVAEAVDAIEAELFDDYVAGALTADAARRFEDRLLASEAGRARLRTATALAAASARGANAEAAVPADAARPVGRAAAPVAVEPTSTWLARARAWLTPPRAAWVMVGAAAAVVLALLQGPSEITSVTLRPDVLRAEVAAERVLVGPRVAVVRLELDLDGEPAQPGWTASVTRGGVEVWRADQVVPKASAVELEIPAARLSPGPHRARILLGGASVAEYVFEIVRE